MVFPNGLKPRCISDFALNFLWNCQEWNARKNLIQAGNYMFEVNNRNTRRRCEIYLKLKVWCLYCFLWTYITPCYSVSIVSFEHVNAGWVCSYWNSFHTHTYILTKENCIEKLQQKTDERVHILQRNFSEPTMNLYNDALHDLARFIQFYTA